MSLSRLAEIHALMEIARNSGVTFIPAVLAIGNGVSAVMQLDCLWELTTWMPGAAATPAQVTPSQVEAAFIALARLHVVWGATRSDRGACPAIQRRCQALQEWESRIRIALEPPPLGRLPKSPRIQRAASPDPTESCAERAWQLLLTHAGKIPTKLSPWMNRHLALQPCLCDIWHDHVLFQGGTVTGLVDFGGVKRDHVAVDLARLLGSLVEDRAELRAAGLEAYRRVRPLSLQEEELVSVLDMTGALVGLMTWLKWLYVDEKLFEERASASRRLQALVERVARWQ
jgi:Ser/Thr protein kinase RdoA (MazF antagonist)